MKSNGTVYVGKHYEEKLERIRIITGQKNHPATIRAIIDALEFDAQQRDVESAPPQIIGFKTLRGAKVRKATAEFNLQDELKKAEQEKASLRDIEQTLNGHTSTTAATMTEAEEYETDKEMRA